MDKILEIKNISKEFPGVKALSNVSFDLERGEVHALVGENGAGKSTLMKILSGVYKSDSGTVLLEGEPVKFRSPKEAQLEGVSIIHQEFSLVPYLTTVENIFLGREIKTSYGALDKKAMRKEATEVLKRLDADIDIDKPVTTLSIANQQFVEIAKAIAIETKILILDEPTASLTGKEIDKLFELIATLKKEGITMVYISHHLDEILHMTDRLTCLRDGEWTGTRLTSECNKQDIIKMMVGREIVNSFPDRPDLKNEDEEYLLEVKNLTNQWVEDIQFDLKKGEIFGIAGLVGSGRTETVRALIGADPVDEKEVYWQGKKVDMKSPAHALIQGIGLIPESRKTQGLVMGMSIQNNVTLSILNKITNSLNFIDRKKEIGIVNQTVDEVLIKTPHIRQQVQNLSGGNQQKVVLGKWLNTDCEILIFDEPTRGIDIGAKEEIYKLIQELTEQGLAIIMISSELPEVLGLSDRIGVMYKGKMVTQMDRKDATSENIMYYATGGKGDEKITDSGS